MLSNLIKNKEYLRSILFGIEDSLISTTGLIAGISVGSDNKKFILMAAIVAVIIEAVSMGVGEYLSDETIQELDKRKRHREKPFISGGLLTISYLIAGMVPIIPVILFDFPTSLILSVILAFLSLFIIGYIKGKVVHTNSYRSGFKILFVGGIATLLGLFVGLFFKI